MKIVSDSSCRVSAVLKYFCPLNLFHIYNQDNSSVDKKQDRLSMSRTKDGPDGSIYERSTIIDEGDTGGAASPTLDYDLNISVTQEELDDLEKDHEIQQVGLIILSWLMEASIHYRT